jgi:hypothetical protein
MKQIHATSGAIALTLIALFGLTIILSMFTGQWKTESSKVPAVIASGEFAGEYDPGDIRGSYTFSDIQSAFGVPVDHLAEAYAFAAGENPETVQPKMFESFPQPEEGEVGTDSLRFFVSLYKGIPYTPEEDTKLPLTAVDLLAEEGKIDTARREELKKQYGVEMGRGTPAAEESSATAELSEPVLDVKGKTTYGELYQAGLTADDIQSIIGIPPEKDAESVRDHLSSEGMEFSEYKARLQEAVIQYAESRQQ